MQLVGCATFRNSCGHFEHAGLARNVNRKYSVSPDFNYEARMEIASEGVRQNEGWEGRMRWKRVGARRKEGKILPREVSNYRGWKSWRLFDRSIAFTTKKVLRIGKISDYSQDIGVKRRSR